MAAMTAMEKRAHRRAKAGASMDMNLVSLIDVFTILIFFLLSSATGTELLSSPKAVKLPASHAEKAPKETIVVVITASEVIIDGRQVSTVPEVMATQGDLIPAIKQELDLLAQRKVVRAENQAQAQAITIMGDKDISYQLLRKIMYTSARANFTDISFAVRRKDS